MAIKPQQPGKLLTVDEVATLASCSPKTIRKEIDRLAIAVTRIGDLVRISEAAYCDWVRRNTTDPVL